jgi:hypothetical protein
VSQPNGGYQHDEELRARIQAFSPDEPGIVFPFSAKLARENGWTRAFAERVMEEYRRFLYLAMTAGHPVSPSVAVDQAWHQHLTYTRSYWDELCGKVLGRPFHHEPTKGGSAESGKFVGWYARTLDSYRAAFGAEPPRDIWPTAEARFAAEARIVQVSAATHWIIRKPRLRREMATTAAAVGALVLVAACRGDEATSLALFAAVGVFILFYVVLAVSHRTRKPAHPRSRASRRRAGTASGGSGWVWFGSGDSCDSASGDCGDSGGSGCGGGGCGGGGCGGCG